MARLAGKAAIVTGAGGGIGRHTAVAMAREGASVLVVDVKAEGVAETVRQVEEAAGAGKAFGVVRDIGDAAGIRDTVSMCAEQFGRIDCMVNNAAIGDGSRLEELTLEKWNAVQNVNVTASILFVKEALPYLAAQPGSSVVNISSIRGQMAMIGGLAYDTSKSAVMGLTRTLAYELGERGIRVNAICPGQIMSHGEESWRHGKSEFAQKAMKNLYPLGHMGRPEEIANVVVFLASEEASFMTGQCLFVDGGLSIANPETAVWNMIRESEQS